MSAPWKALPPSRVLAALIAVAALAASAIGVLHPAVYARVVLDRELPFLLAQDLVSGVAAAALLALTVLGRWRSAKVGVVRTGLVGYLFYAYGMYVLGTLYVPLYFLYQAIFGLSIFYLIATFAGARRERPDRPDWPSLGAPRWLRLVLATACAAIPILFAPQWVAAMWRAMQAGTRPDADAIFSFMYPVYILDLCFVLPVCALTSIALFRNRPSGLLLAGVLQINGFVLILSVALGFLLQPLFHEGLRVADVVQYCAVTLVLLALAILYLARVQEVEAASDAARLGVVSTA